MTFYKRAFRYIQRKKSKTILLLMCFLLISTMVLCAVMILQTAGATNQSIQEKTGTKLVLSNQQGKNDITAETIASICALDSVTQINREASNVAYPADFSPLVMKDGTEPLNMAVTIHAYDNTEIDGLFAQEKYRLLDGQHISENQNGILINSILAEVNGLGIGDSISFETDMGKTISGKVIGIFFSGMERKQADNIAAAYRIENQIYVDYDLFENLFGASGFTSVSVYTDTPETLNDLYTQVEQLVDNETKIVRSDALYMQMQAPLKQVIRITSLMLILIVITAVIVTSLLLCMWTRTRTKEVAIMISLGFSKFNLFLQSVTESISLFVLSVIGAVTINSLFTGLLINKLFSSSDFASLTTAHLEGQHIMTLLLLGSMIVLISVGISIFPTLRANPRDTFSRMEG